jgi:hypothetical protein
MRLNPNVAFGAHARRRSLFRPSIFPFLHLYYSLIYHCEHGFLMYSSMYNTVFICVQYEGVSMHLWFACQAKEYKRYIRSIEALVCLICVCPSVFYECQLEINPSIDSLAFNRPRMTAGTWERAC